MYVCIHVHVYIYIYIVLRKVVNQENCFGKIHNDVYVYIHIHIHTLKCHFQQKMTRAGDIYRNAENSSFFQDISHDKKMSRLYTNIFFF